VPPGPTYPVQFGPFGLLMNTAGDTWEDATGNSGYNSADGIRVAVNLPGVADLHFQAVAIRIIGNIGAFSYASGEDAFGVDANAEIIKGLRVGVDYVGNSIAQSGSDTFSQHPGALSFLYHVYGPGGGSVNPATANCPTAGRCRHHLSRHRQWLRGLRAVGRRRRDSSRRRVGAVERRRARGQRQRISGRADLGIWPTPQSPIG
jgi:hypothetical protein